MNKILLDTNIYGELVKESALLIIKEKIKNKEDLIYGVDVIRKELRDTPKKSLLLSRNLRISLLSLYDEFVGKHTIKLNEEMARTAKKYYKETEEYFKVGDWVSYHWGFVCDKLSPSQVKNLEFYTNKAIEFYNS